MVGIKRSTSSVVSPTRRYVISYMHTFDSKERLFDLKNLSELYVNDINGAISYFKNCPLFDLKTIIISCVPYEFHVKNIREEDKKNRAISEWDCVKLVKRYGYREKEPETFLFALPRIMVKELEEELTQQANLQFMAEFPRYAHGGPYNKENHYSVVFRIVSSGLEHITTYWDHILHREITIYFTDREAIFGLGLREGM